MLEAGVRDDGVEAAVETFERCGDDGLVALTGREIAVLEVDGVHLPAVRAEARRDRRADAARGAGDERVHL